MRPKITPLCPLFLVVEDKESSSDCIDESCAWWDHVENNCCIVTMARWLAALPSYIENLEGGG